MNTIYTNKIHTNSNDIDVVNYDSHIHTDPQTNRVDYNHDANSVVPTSLNNSRADLNNIQSQNNSYRRSRCKKIACIGGVLGGFAFVGAAVGTAVGLGAGRNNDPKFNDAYGNITNPYPNNTYPFNDTYGNITNPNNPYFNETFPENNTYGNVTNPNNATSRFQCDDGSYFFNACSALSDGCSLPFTGDITYQNQLASILNNCVRAAGDWEGNTTNKLVGCTDYVLNNSSVTQDGTKMNIELYCKNNLTNKEYTLDSTLSCKKDIIIKSDNGNGCTR